MIKSFKCHKCTVYAKLSILVTFSIYTLVARRWVNLYVWSEFPWRRRAIIWSKIFFFEGTKSVRDETRRRRVGIDVKRTCETGFQLGCLIIANNICICEIERDFTLCEKTLALKSARFDRLMKIIGIKICQMLPLI